MMHASSMRLFFAKTRRYVRRIPSAFFKSFSEPIFNSGQILAFCTAVIGLALLLRTASPADRDLQADNWAISIQAFLITVTGWAVVSLVRAPLIAINDDKRLGKWHQHHFIYHQPHFVGAVRLTEGDGETYTYPITVEHAEPNSLVYFSVDATPNASNRIRLILSGGSAHPDIKIHHTTDGQIGPSVNPGAHIGSRVSANRSATLYASSLPSTIPIVLRIYCHSFYVGKTDQNYEPAG
jgi:hypothetical protein